MATRRPWNDPAVSLALVVFFAVAGVLLIARAEVLTDDASAASGPIGYLLLQVAAWLALRRLTHHVPAAAALSLGMLVVVIANAILYLSLASGRAGGHFVLAAIAGVVILGSTAVAIVALGLAAWWTIRSGPRPPVVPAVVLGVVAALVVNVAIASGGPQGPAPGGTEPPIAGGSPSPTATPTAPPTTAPVTVTLTIRFGGAGRGSVRIDPLGVTCDSSCTRQLALGSRVTLTPSAAAGSVFIGWSPACSGTGPCELVMRSPLATAASFEPPPAGYDSTLQSCSADATLAPGESRQFTCMFLNRGTTPWTKGTATEVDLAACCPLGAASPLADWRDGWPSDRVYARAVQANVAPGAVATYTFSVRAPRTVASGEYRFDGMLRHTASGAPVPGSAMSVRVTVR
ncbi:MAG TPA: hypothetical protein VFM93_02110 [Candidatus Limnocylindria bacterium]|nr:hypothetical protein [Candidatus Limnocylindria bacterium]